MIKKIKTFIFLIYGFVLPLVSHADTDQPITPITKIENPIGIDNINDFIKAILEGAIKIGLPILVLAIIYSGFLFVAAQGNSEKINKAKQSLLYTILGAAILLGSWGIAQLITETVKSL